MAEGEGKGWCASERKMGHGARQPQEELLADTRLQGGTGAKPSLIKKRRNLMPRSLTLNTRHPLAHVLLASGAHPPEAFSRPQALQSGRLYFAANSPSTVHLLR